MTDTVIETALRNADDTRVIAFGLSVLDRTGPLFAELFPGKKALVVADENAFGSAGEQVERSLDDAGVAIRPRKVFPGTPTLYANYSNVEVLRELVRPMEDTIICSIASGSPPQAHKNDLEGTRAPSATHTPLSLRA